ncbi:hypothetical protein B0H63DRAFT_167086 [Podospora didyma]|uniref:CENP-V/GFA domain-containing protein n=1 Tax=Podospora didyma TaxID=330526 RepID=A0AAE0U1Z4_9PEZI|nr:hypothetical protein B0H63DRAFT_167086 [Podospora didyma]
MASSTTYHGNCHCGQYRFELTLPEITEGITCTCGLCSKKGYLWLPLLSDTSFEVMRDDGSLISYQSAVLGDKFCNRCGTAVLGEHLDGPLRGQKLVNIRTIQGINPFQLESSKAIRTVPTDDKRHLELLSTPSTEIPAQHTGSCHCGAIRVELLVPINDVEAKEDNCSSCVRNAYVGIYPTKDQVRIHGRENTFEYRHGRKFSGTLYCKSCGVHVFSNVYGPPLSVFDSLPPDRKERVMAAYWKNMALQPLNARIFDGLKLESLQVKRSDEGTEGYALDP